MQAPAGQTNGDAAAQPGGTAKAAHTGQGRGLLGGVPGGTDHWPSRGRTDGAPVG